MTLTKGEMMTENKIPKMTPKELIKQEIEVVAARDNWDPQDVEMEMREGQYSTGLPSKDYSRHYEEDQVAALIGDVWIGWTYWHGGGKHGEPESIPWMDDAYFLDVTETEKMVTVRTFAKSESK